jgi:hypothetical protein
MVLGNKKLATTKIAGKSLAISIAIWPGLHSEPLDAAIGQVPVPYCPGGRHDRKIH